MSRDGHRGFTIVELLIVIVVIAILAAITAVGYNNITRSAHDAAIKNDLRNLASLFQQSEIDYGAYPRANARLSTLSFKASKSSYMQAPDTTYNLTVCNSTDPTIKNSAVIARSKSGNIFSIHSGDGFTIKEFAIENWHNEDSTGSLRCQAIDTDLGKIDAGTGNHNIYNGYNSLDTNSGPWRAWTNAGTYIQ